MIYWFCFLRLGRVFERINNVDNWYDWIGLGLDSNLKRQTCFVQRNPSSRLILAKSLWNKHTNKTKCFQKALHWLWLRRARLAYMRVKLHTMSLRLLCRKLMLQSLAAFSGRTPWWWTSLLGSFRVWLVGVKVVNAMRISSPPTTRGFAGLHWHDVMVAVVLTKDDGHQNWRQAS